MGGVGLSTGCAETVEVVGFKSEAGVVLGRYRPASPTVKACGGS